MLGRNLIIVRDVGKDLLKRVVGIDIRIYVLVPAVSRQLCESGRVACLVSGLGEKNFRVFPTALLLKY